LLALALPVFAQDTAPSANEVLFYKAFFLEKGERDFAAAMSLYEKFLTAEPNHRLAKVAAQNNLNLLQRTGKGKDAEVFAQKYEKLLGGVAAPAPAPADRPAAEGEAPRGEGRGQGGPGGQGGQRGQGRPAMTPEQMQERLKGLKDELAKAKESGDTERVAQLERQIARMENPQAGQRGQGGQGGPGGQGGRRGMQVKKFADMSKDELEEFKTTRLDGMTRFIDRIRESQGDEAAKKMEDGIAEVKKALDAGKTEDAQKAYDKLMEGMRGGRRGGGGGGN
jgi:hypothetical protein